MENTCQESCIKNIDKIDQLKVTNGILVRNKCIAKLRTKIWRVGKKF